MVAELVWLVLRERDQQPSIPLVTHGCLLETMELVKVVGLRGVDLLVRVVSRHREVPRERHRPKIDRATFEATHGDRLGLVLVRTTFQWASTPISG